MINNNLYEVMAGEFPPTHAEDHYWEYLHDGRVANADAIMDLMSRHIRSPEVMVLIRHLEVAARMPKADAASLVADHSPNGEIQISDPELISFITISQIGVAACWNQAQPGVQADRPYEATAGGLT